MKNQKVIPQSPHIDTICYGLKHMNIEHICEFQFHPVRFFRFDIAIPSLKVAIEYEGIMTIKGGTKSRHTTVTGHSTDCENTTLRRWKAGGCSDTRL